MYKKQKFELVIALRRFNHKILIPRADLEDYEYFHVKSIPDRKNVFINRFYNTYSSGTYYKYLTHELIKMFDNNYNFDENINYEEYRQKKLQGLVGIHNMEERNKLLSQPKVEPKVIQIIKPKNVGQKKSLFDELDEDEDDNIFLSISKTKEQLEPSKPIKKTPPPVPPKPIKKLSQSLSVLNTPVLEQTKKQSNIELLKIKLFSSIK
jgi:hypothetical protein